MSDDNVEWKETEWRTNRNVESAQFYLNMLIDNYKTSDPTLGENSATMKTDLAYATIEIFWRLFDELAAWAQAHIAGREVFLEDDRIQVALGGHKFDQYFDDIHELEKLGWFYSLNQPIGVNDEIFTKKVEPYFGDILNDKILRNIIRELLHSRSANSSYWRFPLRSGLRALNYGAQEDLLRPEKTKKRGDAADVAYLQKLVLYHLNFERGKGIKKFIALEKISKIIGKSPETIGDWEDAYQMKHDYIRDEFACKLAGFFEEVINDFNTEDFHKLAEKHFEIEFFKNIHDAERAQTIYKLFIKGYSLEKLAKLLKEAESGVKKKAALQE